jgi:hypothetical protein
MKRQGNKTPNGNQFLSGSFVGDEGMNKGQLCRID